MNDAVQPVRPEADAGPTPEGIEELAAALHAQPGVWLELKQDVDPRFVNKLRLGLVPDIGGVGEVQVRKRGQQTFVRWFGPDRAVAPNPRNIWRYNHKAIRADAVRAEGEWVFAEGFPRVYMYRIRRGLMGYWPAGTYDAVVARTAEGDVVGLWVRHVSA